MHSARVRGVGGGVGRVDSRLRTGGPATGRRAVGQHRRAGRRHGAAVCGDRCRGGLAGGADGSARPVVLASVVRCAACRSGIRQQLCLGGRDPVAARAVGRSLDHDAVVLPVHVSARGRDAAPARSGRRGIGPRAGIRFGRCVLPRGAAATAAGDPRRRPVDRRAPARRVRRIRHGAVRHLHGRDLPAVPGHLRRGGGQHAGRCARAAVPGAADRRGGGAWEHAIRQDRRRRTAGCDSDPPGPQHDTGVGGAGGVGAVGARRPGVDDSAVAVDRRRRRVGASTTSAPRSARPSAWPPWRRC